MVVWIKVVALIMKNVNVTSKIIMNIKNCIPVICSKLLLTL